jgi:hypothetical protein
MGPARGAFSVGGNSFYTFRQKSIDSFGKSPILRSVTQQTVLGQPAFYLIIYLDKYVLGQSQQWLSASLAVHLWRARA